MLQPDPVLDNGKCSNLFRPHFCLSDPMFLGASLEGALSVATFSAVVFGDAKCSNLFQRCFPSDPNSSNLFRPRFLGHT